MPQIFSRSDVLAVKLVLLALLLAAAVGFWIATWRMSAAVDVGNMPTQPIPFSHKHHAGDDGIDCRYCHVSVETSSFAGMPSTRVCLTCHSQLFKDAPMLAPLHESAATGRRIHWVRVYDLPDFVYFDHSIHLAKGVGCIQCHGEVDRMPITRRFAPLTMQWCLECHRNPGPRLRPPEQLLSTRPTPAPSAQQAHALVRYYQLASRRRMTDCSTCHR
jgi:hypothetical protein